MELYIHIPFCVRKCRYCDFLSFASDACVREKYVDQLIREIESIPEEDAGQCPENAAPGLTAFVTNNMAVAAKPDRADGGDDLYRRRNAVPASTIGD